MVVQEPRAKDRPEFDNHALVVRFEDFESGLKGFVAIHNDSMGPAVGGTRMFPYTTEEDALSDVLRLSRAMTYKCALAGTHHGGGKAVIIGDPDKDKSEALIEAYAKVINELHGKFFTGEDVGITESDVQRMFTVAPYFIGRTGYAGDPSPYAALSTYYSIQTTAKFTWGIDTLKGKTVAIKGVGKVGGELARLLSQDGASIVIADVDSKATARVVKQIPSARVVKPKDIHKEAVDVYAPCALGNEFTKKTIQEVKTHIICGAANNQLATDEVGDALFEAGIVYIPDYIANAGGLLDVVDELEVGGFNSKRVVQNIVKVKDTVQKVLDMSRDLHKPTNRVADMMAEEIFLKESTTTL